MTLKKKKVRILNFARLNFKNAKWRFPGRRPIKGLAVEVSPREGLKEEGLQVGGQTAVQIYLDRLIYTGCRQTETHGRQDKQIFHKWYANKSLKG